MPTQKYVYCPDCDTLYAFHDPSDRTCVCGNKLQFVPGPFSPACPAPDRLVQCIECRRMLPDQRPPGRTCPVCGTDGMWAKLHFPTK